MNTSVALRNKLDVALSVLLVLLIEIKSVCANGDPLDRAVHGKD